MDLDLLLHRAREEEIVEKEDYCCDDEQRGQQDEKLMGERGREEGHWHGQ
jgi:hypothetical protein